MHENELQDSNEFRDIVLELRRRWKIAQSALGVTSFQLVDLVAKVDPDFECEIQLMSSDDTQRGLLERYDFRFRTFPATAQLPSPYEVLLELHDRGCTLVAEHGIIDIWSPAGEMLGGVAGAIPWEQGSP